MDDLPTRFSDGASDEDRRRYTSLLDSVLRGADLEDEPARQAAYARCIEYAQERMNDDFHVNLFLGLAAERLGQLRVHFPVVEDRGPMPDNARLHLTRRGHVTLTGNPEGLRYLSKLLSVLASAPGPHEHAHLREEEPPLRGDSVPVTFYHEPDAWFDRYASAERGDIKTIARKRPQRGPMRSR